MATRLTLVLREQLLAINANPDDFAKQFDAWKSRPDLEFEDFLFGKDGAYRLPLVNGAKNILRHVHLVPLQDPTQLPRWKAIWKRRGRKTSDRALVYVSDATHGNLLIFILDDPNAHAIASMLTDDHKALMNKFALIADKFIHSGETVA